MAKNQDAWVEQLSSLEIPALSSSLQSIGTLQAKHDVSAAKIAAAILPDPALLLKLLRLVNAGKHGEFAQRIATAEHAIMMLGLNATFSRLLETPALETALPEEVQSGLLRCIARSCHAATHAREWAVQRLDSNVEEVYVAALLQQAGEMALWLVNPDQMLLLDKARRKLSVEEAEIQVYGFTLKNLSLALAERWNMPPLVIAAMQSGVDEMPVRPRCIALASRLSLDAEWGWYGETVANDIQDIADARRLPLDDVSAQIHGTAAEAARKLTFQGVQSAACWLPMLPGEWPEEEPPAEPVTAPVTDPFQFAMDEIARHLDETLSLTDLLVLVVRGLREGVGFSRVVFALLTSDRGTLAAKYVIGAETGSPLKSFRFDMKSRHLMSVLMAKPQAIWMTEANRVKYAEFLNQDIVNTTTGYEFQAMSLSVHGKVIGLFYADREGRPLDVESYDKFKQLCSRAASGMEHLAKPGAA